MLDFLISNNPIIQLYIFVMTNEKGTKFTLDGQTVYARSGETVLSVAKRHGIQIPSLCHHESVLPSGACRLCLVEACWGKRSKLVTSCIYIPWEKDVILTNSERVRKTRSLIIELLIGRCPDVKILQKLAEEYGVTECRFQAKTVTADIEHCILCGLCVRVCDEVVGQNAINYANRGIKRVITTPFDDQAEECIGCGACVFVCPTGALHYEDIDGERVMKELHTRMPLLNCKVCDRPFATEKQIAKCRDRLKLPQDLAETCPKCRGTEFRELLANCLTSNKNEKTTINASKEK